MYCKYCGAEIEEKSRYCPKCGNPVGVADSDSMESKTHKDTVLQRPRNHLLLAILTTVFCCLPLGIVSIIYAAKTDDAWNVGKYEDAMFYSKKARSYALWGIFSLVILFVLYVILIAAGVCMFADAFDEPLQELFQS